MEYSQIYTFCPICKSELKHDTDRFFKCPHCDFYFYVNPVPCNAVIAENDNGEILLVKRKYDPFGGWWDVPGGFMSIEESAEDSVRREIQEELGVEVTNLKYFHSFNDRYMYKNIDYYTIGLVFTGEVDATKIVPNDDVTEIQYFKKDSLPFEKIAFRAVRTALQKYLAMK